MHIFVMRSHSPTLFVMRENLRHAQGEFTLCARESHDFGGAPDLGGRSFPNSYEGTLRASNDQSLSKLSFSIISWDAKSWDAQEPLVRVSFHDCTLVAASVPQMDPIKIMECRPATRVPPTIPE